MVRNTAKRTWRLRAALTQLLRQRTCSGHVLRVIVGHLCHFFMIRRCALSCLAAVWTYIEEYGKEVGELPGVVRAELAVARGLLPVIRHNAGRSPCSRMSLSDSSGSGFALLESGLTHADYWDAANRDERWRFRPVLTETDGPWTIAAAAETPECILLAGGTDDYREDLEHDSDGELVRSARPGNELEDNMSEVLAMEKGRARNYELISLCRHSASLQISADIQWDRRHVISEKNCADFD